jgi:2-hydroxy-3-keto-5-methylthiopentenyl-1-phosphate phosphatase
MDPIELHNNNSVDFKRDLVDYYKGREYFVVFIGDGMFDKEAARGADYVFTIQGSRLADSCRKGD